MNKCSISKPQHKAEVKYQYFIESTQQWSDALDVTEILHDRTLSHHCEVSEFIYNTPQSNKVRFVFYYGDPTMLDKFVISGITALSAISFSVFAGDDTYPSVPVDRVSVSHIEENNDGLPNRTANKEINFAAITAATFVLLLDGGPVESGAEPENLIRNGDFSSGLDFWNSRSVYIGADDGRPFSPPSITPFTIAPDTNEEFSNLLFTNVVAENSDPVIYQHFVSQQLMPSNFETDQVILNFDYVRFSNSNIPTNSAFVRVEHVDVNGNRIGSIIVNERVTQGAESSRTIVAPFTMPELQNGESVRVEVRATGEGAFFFDNFSVTEDRQGPFSRNISYDIRSLFAGVESFRVNDWNFQRGAKFDRVRDYSRLRSQETRVKRRKFTSRTDSVSFIAQSDNSIDKFNDLVDHQLPNDGLCYWKRDRNSLDPRGSFLAYMETTGITNDDENINSINATFEEVHTWL